MTNEISHYSTYFMDFSLADTRLFLCALFLSSVWISSLLKIFLLSFQTRLGFNIGHEVSLIIFNHCLNQPYHIHQSRNSSELISIVALKANLIASKLVLPVLAIVTNVILILVASVTVFALSKQGAAISFSSLLPLYILFYYRYKNKITENSHNVSIYSDKVIKTLTEGFGGIREILLNANQKRFTNEFRYSDKKLRNSQASNQIYSIFPKYIIEAIGISLIVFIANLFLEQGTGNENIIAQLGAIGFAAQRMLPYSQLIFQSFNAIRSGSSPISDSLRVLETETETHTPSVHGGLTFEGSLQFQNVQFDYGDRSILNNVNFEIFKGEHVCLIGKTGSGKSTILDIITGLQSPKSGNILIDEKKLTKQNHHFWRERVSYVSQHSFFYDLSVHENISHASFDDVDIERVHKVSEISRIKDDVELLPKGFQTHVGESGTKFSGGQRQRIAIARALYRDFDLLILDEATTGLHEEIESEILKNIKDKMTDKTVIFVTHKKSLIPLFDKVINLDVLKC